MSGSSGSQRASRTRTTPNSLGGSARGPRSPIRVVADPARSSNDIFGALAEKGNDSENRAEDSGTSIPASSPFFSNCFLKPLADRKFDDPFLELFIPFRPAAEGRHILEELSGYQEKLQQYVQNHEDTYFAKTDASTCKRKMIPDQTIF